MNGERQAHQIARSGHSITKTDEVFAAASGGRLLNHGGGLNMFSNSFANPSGAVARVLAATAAVAVVSFLGLPASAAAQENGAIQGQVIDAADQRPLVNAQVVIAGTTIGTLTNGDGNYRIGELSPGSYEVRVTTLGYSQASQTAQVVAGEVAAANFSLDVTAVQLDAVTVNVVSGREMRRRELGSNIASIDVASIDKAQIRNFNDLVSGRSEGLWLQNVSGNTGGAQKIRIRGASSISLSNEPLIYIDGYLTNNSAQLGPSGNFGVGGQEGNRLNDLNPNDIETIEVVKGPAAAALYGAAGANGAILITTKRGAGGSTQWGLYGEYGAVEMLESFPTNIASFQVADASQPIYTPQGFLNTDNAASCPLFMAAEELCTIDDVLEFDHFGDERTTPFSRGNRQRYGVNAAGGGDAVTFFLSGDYEKEEGVIFYNTLDRLNLRANATAQVTRDLNINLNTNYINSDVIFPNNDNSILGVMLNAQLGLPTFAPEGDLGPAANNNYGFGFDPEDTSKDVHNQDTDRFNVGVNGTWSATPWLAINANLGLDVSFTHDNETVQAGDIPIGSPFSEGFRQSERATDLFLTANASAAATFPISSNWQSTTTAGFQYLDEDLQTTFCFGAGQVINTTSCASTSSLFAVDEEFNKLVTIGFFGQQEFSFGDRLFIAGSIRGDDNSAFGSASTFQWYPGGSLSYVVSDTNWWNVGWFSDFRVRGAIGTAGVRPQFRQAITLFGPVSVERNGFSESAVTINVTGNEELKPERSTEWEVGFDAGFLNNRLGIDFSYYNKTSRDALIARPIAPSFGLTSSFGTGAGTSTVFDNIGEIQNWGTEVSLNALAVNSRSVVLNLRLIHTTFNNRINDIGGVDDIIINRGEQRHREGFAAGSYFQRPIEFEDTNGDGLLAFGFVGDPEIDTGDCVEGDLPEGEICEVFLDQSIPTYTGSFVLDMELFGFLTFNTLFEGRGGNSLLNFSEFAQCTVSNCRGTSDPTAGLEAQAAWLASIGAGGTGASRAGYIEDGKFAKWRELTMRIGVPPSWAGNSKFLKGLSLSLAGRNLATWTNYQGVDPEINETGGSSNFTSGDLATLPAPGYFTARLDIRL
jgi:TonB-linked SusC/RagA family outer membrane protein